MRAALAAALILLLAACGADNAATSSPESSIADEVSDITLSPQAMRNAVLTAVNMTGLLSVDTTTGLS
jgi:ABC-type Fe3+-citrate transport system substrate-binding protein